MNILLTNDDGVYSPGLRALARALSQEHKLYLAAPSMEHSGQGHAITLGNPLELKPITYPHVKAAWRIEGTPADCVKIAFTKLLHEPVDLVVSGINNGANVGPSVFYSGTIAAAVEAALGNVAGLAVSTEHSRRPKFNEIAAHLLGVLQKLKPTPGSCFNLNYPDPRRVKWGPVLAAHQSIQGFQEVYSQQKLRDGQPVYTLSGELDLNQESNDSDVSLLSRGAITLTPIRKDFTDKGGLQHIRNIFGNMPPPLPS